MTKKKPTKLESFAGWAKLAPKEQQVVRRAADSVTHALLQEGQSKIAIGESLEAIRTILHPKHLWMKFLKTQFHMSSATAYRYIEEYQAVVKALPKTVLAVAKERGFKIKPGAVFTNPPPVTDNVKEIVHYLEKMERPTVVNPPQTVDSDMLLKECVNFVRTRFERLAGNGKTKTAFIRALIGMLLSTFGISSSASYEPIAVPGHFRAKLGRPLKEAA